MNRLVEIEMENDNDRGRREVLTLNWRRGDGAAPCDANDDEYIQCDDVARLTSKSSTKADIEMPPAGPVDLFIKRMENWRMTVRGSIGGGRSGFCAEWARWYVITRTVDKNVLKTFIEPELCPPRAPITVDELDGWLVEAAVRSLADFDQRKVLHYWYVFQYPEHWIRNKLLLRRSGVMLVKGRAENNLRILFTKLETAANILSNKLHAGVDPRPESKDALEGAASPPENEKALIE